MKKIFILTITILSSFLLVGCDSSNNKESENKPEVKIDTNIKKTKYKKLICSNVEYGDNITANSSITIDFNESGKPTKLYLNLITTIDKNYFNNMTDKEKESEINRIKNIISESFNDYANNFKVTQTIKDNDNIIKGELTSEDKNLFEEFKTIEEAKQYMESGEDGLSCFIQDVEY